MPRKSKRRRSWTPDPTRKEIDAMCAEIRKEWVKPKRTTDVENFILSYREPRRYRLHHDNA